MRVYKILADGTVKNRDISRQELLTKFTLHQRDLRPLILLNQTPTILTRPRCYIVNLGFLRLVIGEETAYVFNIDHRFVADHFIEDLTARFANRAKHKQSRFEFLVLESALHVKMDKVMMDYTRLAGEIEASFESLSQTLSNEQLERLLSQKKRLSRLETSVEQLQRLLHDILDDDDELQDFMLSSSSTEAEDEIEFIIEHYDEQVDHVLNKIFDLKENIEDTQSIINLKMSSLRNSLIRLDLFFTIFAAAMALPTLVAGIFGMNIVNTFEQNFFAFLVICLLTLCIVGVVIVGAFFHLRRKKIY